MNIFITGTSSGLGYALAKRFLDDHHMVYGVSRKSNETLDTYDNFKFLSQDLADLSYAGIHLANFFEREKVEGLDLVVLNAGIINDIKDMKDTSIEELKRIMDINVWSNKVILDTLFQTVRNVRQVAAISSGAARSGARGWNGYAISKAALNILIRLYSNEQPDTHFSSIAPGLIDTQLQDYISSLPKKDKYPVVARLQDARGTKDMPVPEEAAPILIKAFMKALDQESGNEMDVRKI
ncbi:MAG: SDR family NAD(P)-dependent oxidoreductase [Bacteroidales bacterium]